MMLPLVGLGMILGLVVFVLFLQIRYDLGTWKDVLFQIRYDLGTWKEAFKIIGYVFGTATWIGIGMYFISK